MEQNRTSYTAVVVRVTDYADDQISQTSTCSLIKLKQVIYESLLSRKTCKNKPH